jgi:ppGpp synthetase/RelA/SpoT-type nucleotidyltranferase
LSQQLVHLYAMGHPTSMSGQATNTKKRAEGYRLSSLVKRQLRLAHSVQDEFEDYTHKVLGGLGVEIGAVNIKTAGRTSQKATKDYGGIVDRVGDVIRLKVTCDTADQIKKVRMALWRQQDLAVARHGRKIDTPEGAPEPVITKINDYFADPKEHGYRCLNVKLRMPNGLQAEIQVVHRGMEAISKQTHGAYKQLSELLREVGDQPFSAKQAKQYQRLVTRLATSYDHVAAEPGLDELTTMTARSNATERRQRLKELVALAEAGETVTPNSRPNPGVSGLSLSSADRASRFTPVDLENRIDMLIQVHHDLMAAGQSANNETSTVYAQEIVWLSRNWRDLPEKLQDRLVEEGLGAAGLRHSVQNREPAPQQPASSNSSRGSTAPRGPAPSP